MIVPRGIKAPISRRGRQDDPSSDIVRIATSPITNSAVSSQLSRHSDVDHHEHITDVLRFRVVMCAALLLWCVTVLLDWSAVRFVEHGSLGYFLFWRGIALLVMGLAVVRLFVGQLPSARQFQALSYAIFCSAMLSASMLCLRYRGIASPYAHAFSVILVARAVALPSHYRQGIPAVLVPASVFPLTMLAAAYFLPAIRAQLRDPAQLSLFLQSIALVFCTGALTIAGGHRMWSLRRQVFEARNIGRYKLRRRIGSGGMGEVWQAYHPALRRDVALKILRAQQVSPNALSRFEREVRATSELQHPNTIRVFDCGVTEDGLWYYAMELLQGETLAALVAREGGLEPERAIRLLRQACRALAEAHMRGIVHRDIKPENLFITTMGGETDFVKVLDFGIAKLLHDEARITGNATLEGTLLGTPAFMSPEQAHARPVDARTDVFSLGAVLYFALTGRPPYDGEDLREIVAAQTLPPLSLSDIAKYPVPPKLEAVVLRCLAYEASRRYATAGELDHAIVTEVTPEL